MDEFFHIDEDDYKAEKCTLIAEDIPLNTDKERGQYVYTYKINNKEIEPNSWNNNTIQLNSQKELYGNNPDQNYQKSKSEPEPEPGSEPEPKYEPELNSESDNYYDHDNLEFKWSFITNYIKLNYIFIYIINTFYSKNNYGTERDL